MLTPKKVKHRKWQRDRRNMSKMIMDTRGTVLSFGSHGLKSLAYGRITSNQIESGRKAMSRFIKKFGKIWIRIFPDRPITKKAPEVPMGGGKGDPCGYCFEVKPGRIIFEIDGVDDATAQMALRRAADKLPVKSTIITRMIRT